MNKSHKKKAQKKKGTFAETVKFLQTIGYLGKFQGENEDQTYRITTDQLEICVFNRNYPHPKLAGKIVADQKNNFDKWQTAYYFADFPTSKKQQESVHDQLIEICNDYHTKRSKKFFEYFNRYTI